MSLTFITESWTAMGIMAFYKTDLPNQTTPIKHRVLGLIAEMTNKLATQPAKTPKTIARRIPKTRKDQTIHLFIYLMEKALIGSLISLWILAAWVVLNGIHSLIF